ncbi:hypothetical protein [Streptomyces hydrogenans]
MADVANGNPSPGFYRGTGAWRTPFRPFVGTNTINYRPTFDLYG